MEAPTGIFHHLQQETARATNRSSRDETDLAIGCIFLWLLSVGYICDYSRVVDTRRTHGSVPQYTHILICTSGSSTVLFQLENASAQVPRRYGSCETFPGQ